ncbi:MAG: hypothetical protein E7270_05225 [Lachnospiraceae bacterium]|nr:hypothetical protein [Lachnospiraceae bacterium]
MNKQYVKSERAHFMCPNMHFGILLEVKNEYNKAKVEATLNRMAEAHPFLKALIAYEDGTHNLFYKITDSSKIMLTINNDELQLWENYKKLSHQDWNVFENGMLKVHIYPMEQGMKVLLVAHHLLADGRGLLEIAQEFANDYVGGQAPVYVEEKLIKSIEDLPSKSSLGGISKMLVRHANNQWKKENKIVSYEDYRKFVKEYSRQNQIEFNTYEVDEETLEQMLTICRENDFSMNDLLMTYMYVKTGIKKIIIAADIRDKVAGYKKGSLGNFSTATGIVCKSKTTDIVKFAKKVHKSVNKRLNNNRKLMLVLACYFEMSPTLLDAAAISVLGGFESSAAKFVGGGMFGFAEAKSYSITNLGKFENENIKSIMFIPPASPAAKFTLGVVTLNGKMTACSSKNMRKI